MYRQRYAFAASRSHRHGGTSFSGHRGKQRADFSTCQLKVHLVGLHLVAHCTRHLFRANNHGSVVAMFGAASSDAPSAKTSIRVFFCMNNCDIADGTSWIPSLASKSLINEHELFSLTLYMVCVELLKVMIRAERKCYEK